MKRKGWIVLVAVLAMLACSEKRVSETAAPSDGAKAVYEVEDENVSCKITADVPEVSLRQAVGEWLSEQLCGYYEGDVSDIHALVDFYGRSVTDSLRHEHAGMPLGMMVAFEATMEKAYETAEYVTFTYSTFLNLGGAHPSSSEEGATFRKSDGRRLSWDIIRRDQRYLFSQLMTESLKGYFGMDDDDLLQVLGEQNFYNPPLPSTPPFFLENGVVYIYQQYEIASYAMGMPTDTIAFERIAPLLTTGARRLLTNP